MKLRHDIYSSITAQLVAAIEAGAGEWRMPWHHRGAPVMRPRSAAGRAYSGINRRVLWASAEARGFESGTWATFRSEEHTSELQSRQRSSYAVFSLTKKKNN